MSLTFYYRPIVRLLIEYEVVVFSLCFTRLLSRKAEFNLPYSPREWYSNVSGAWFTQPTRQRLNLQT